MGNLSSARQNQFEKLWESVQSNVDVLSVTSTWLRERGHQSWVWDATKQPTRSHYFPVYVNLFESLEKRSEIDPDQHFLVETTTGNAGSAAAYVADELGYDILIFMPEDMPESRIQDVRHHLGDSSELRLTESETYVSGTVRRLRRFLATHRDGYKGKEVYAMDHSRRPESVEAIQKVAEWALTEHLPRRVHIDTCVLALGNGTTFSGVKSAVQASDRQTELIGVEPAEAPRFYTEKYSEERLRQEFGVDPEFHPHRLLGTGGWNVDFPNVDIESIDRVELTFEHEWTCMLGRLHDAGYPVGHTSAACQWIVERLSAAYELSSRENSSFFGLFYDPIDKY